MNPEHSDQDGPKRGTGTALVIPADASSSPPTRHFAARNDSERARNTLGWVFFAAGVILFAGQLLRPVDPQDEGQFLTYPWLIALGRVPYRDIWMSYPPGTYLLLVPFFKIGLPGLAVERALGLSTRLAYILLANRLVTGSWSRWSWIAGPATLSLVFLGSDVKAYPWLVAMPLLVLGLAVVTERPALASLLFLLSGCFRFEFMVAGTVAMLALGLLPSPGGARRRHLFWACATGVAGAAFYAILSSLTAGAAWQQIFVDQVGVVQRGRFLALLPLPFGPLGVPILVTMLVAPLALVVVSLAARCYDVTATNLAVLSLMPHFFQRVDASHLFTTAALVVPWAVISLIRLRRHVPPPFPTIANWISLSRIADGMWSWIGVTVSIWASLLTAAYAVYLSPISPASDQPIQEFRARVFHGAHVGIASDVAEARDDQQVVSYFATHAHASDGLLVIPVSLSSGYSRTDLYYDVGVTPVGRYLEVQPNVITPRVERDLVRDMKRCRWVIQLHGGRWYFPANPARRYFLEAYIGRHYRRVLRNSTYDVLQRSQ